MQTRLGEFWIAVEDFCEEFKWVHACRLFPAREGWVRRCVRGVFVGGGRAAKKLSLIHI